MKYIILVVLLLSCSSLISLAQQENDQRNITISVSDSVINTSILEKPMKRKILSSGTYYWYYAGKINHNQGGFSGKLLHGKYELFDNKHRLVTLGNFENGVKQDTWTWWRENGTIKESCYFRKGMLDGSLKTFDSSGQLLSDVNYKNNFIDGTARYYSKDTVIIKKYCKGKVLPPEKHRKLFARNKVKKELVDTGATPKKPEEKSTSHWKFSSIFKKHKPVQEKPENKTQTPTNK